MKFSKKLYERSHPKYREHYIAYKELKKVIKLITGKDTSTYTIKEVTSNFGNIRALSGAEYKSTESRFQDLLNYELDKINKFTLNIIKDWFNEAEFYYSKLKEECFLDLKSVESKLIELGDTLIFLEGYKNINFIGFRKITKKFDKHSDTNVSSSFYISVVIKSFFMNFDMNFLVCILSICYKYFRTMKNKYNNVDPKFMEETSLNKNGIVENDNIDKKHNFKIVEEKKEKINKNDVEIIEGITSYPINENNDLIKSEKEENNLTENNLNVKNTKYIVKLQDLITVKVEIAKNFTFRYYNIEEYEFIPNIKKFLEMISTTKIQNYMITIYFDDSNLSTYHNFVNRNVSNANEYIRIRSYNYIKGKKHEEKTMLQRFNIYEPSHDDNEKCTFMKDLPSNNLKIENINDLHKLKECVVDTNLGIDKKEQKGKNKEENITKNDKTNEEKKFNKDKENSLTKNFGDNRNNINNDFILQNKSYFMDFMNEIETKKLRSYVRSKFNRLYFSDGSISGYIDENICYWTHNDKKNIYINEESDEDEEDEEEEDEEEEDEEGNGKESDEDEEYNNLNKSGNFNKNNRKDNKNFKKDYLKVHKKANNKKYSYFDYAVIDISTKEQANRNFIFKLNHLDMAREIWGYSSFLQGISLLYPNCISTYPHWRIYTCTEFMKIESTDHSKKKKKAKTKTKEVIESDTKSDTSLNENVNNYKKQIKQYIYKTKEDHKKSITYTGASARIAHESEVIFRNEIEKKKSSIDIDFNQYDNNSKSYFPNNSKILPITKPFIGGDNNNNLYEPLLDSMEDKNFERTKSSSGKIFSFFKNFFFKKNSTIHNKRPKNSVVRVEPKTFFANERTLLQWLNTSVLLSTISITLLNFSNTYGFISGVIMAPVAIFFILYSFHVYLKRARALVNKEPINYTDRLGPGILVITLTFSLSTVVILNVYSRLKYGT